MALEGLSISRLPQRTQLLLLTVVMAGLCYVFYDYYIQPLRTEVTRLSSQVNELTNEVQKGHIVYSRLREFKKQVEEQEIKLATLRSILPERKQTAEIVSGLELLARESRLKIKSFQPQGTVRKDFYEDWPILLSLEGNYNNLGLFFEKVSQYTRIINVDNITIKKVDQPSRNRTISATCTATTFVYVDPEPDSSTEQEQPSPATAVSKEQPRRAITS
ncbi:MAG TPA: type 4a pilus biogenesis protein PilO [Acidobacteriota bacterium]|mgnify:FL=1|nr:type 4a pilus biogenesis protein PilO [Acidobacteriota bacterium]